MKSRSVWNVDHNDFPKNGKLEQKLKFLIRYAILAPSGHNSQPWKFILTSKSIEVWPDYERRRMAVDPEDRELYLSLGAAVKNIEIAANYFGMIYDKKYEINNRKGLGVIILTFKEGRKIGNDTKIFEAITQRRTNRGELKIPEKRIKMEFLENNLAKGVLIEKSLREQIGKLIYDSNKVWFKSKDLVNELDYWIQDDINSHDGVLINKITQGLKNFLTKDSDAAIKKAEMEKQLALKAPYLMIMESKEENIEAWIKTGELFEEILLILTTQGLSAAYFNTVIELKTQRLKLKQMLNIKGWPQLFLRIGKPILEVPHSGRRPIEEVII